MTSQPAHFVLDPADGGRFVHVSEGVCRFFARSREELLKWRLGDWIPGLDQGRLQELWNEVRTARSATLQLQRCSGMQANPISISFEHFEFAGGEQVAGHILSSSSRYSEHKIRAILPGDETHRLCDSRDFRAQPQAFDVQADELAESCSVRGRLSLVEFALGLVPDAVYLADEQGRLRYANQAACRGHGYSWEAFLSLNVADIDLALRREGWPQFQFRLKDADSLMLEAQHCTSDGKVFPMEISARRFQFDGAVYFLFVARDISERKRLENRLRESERLHRTLMQNFPDFIVRLDTECRHVYVSPAVLSFWNKPKEFFLGRTVCEIDLLGDDGSNRKLLESARRTLATASPDRIELRAEFEDQVYLEVRHIPELDEDGRVVSVIATARDVTEVRRQQRREEGRHAIFRAMALGAGFTETLDRVIHYVASVTPGLHPYILLATDEGMRLISTSDFPVEFSRLMADRAIEGRAGSCSIAIRYGRTAIAEDIATHADWQYCREAVLKAGFRSGWAEPIFAANGLMLGAFGIFRNVEGGPAAEELETVRRACHLAAIAIGRHRLEQERDFREQQFRALADNAPTVIVRYDTQCRRVFVNKELERRSGVEAKQMLGRAPSEFSGILEPIVDFYEDQIHKVQQTGKSVEVEKEWTTSSGMEFCSILRFVPEHDAHGRITSVLVLGHDITERRRAERALQTSERQFRSLVENSPDAIVRYDRHFRRQYLNPSARRLFGLLNENVLGATPLDGRSPVSSVPGFMDGLRQVVETGLPMTIEMGCRRPAGQELWGHVCFVPEMDEDGRVSGVLVIARNATELIKSRKELADSRALLRDLRAHSEEAREEERKRLSRELHDELGQLLTTLRLNISLLRMSHAGENPALDGAAAECIGLVDTSLKAVRGIAAALRPLALDMGLTAAIKWQLDQFIEHTSVPVELAIDAEEISTTESQSLLIFRILQESLTNITRHAQARRVRVNLKRDGAAYILRVKDYGRGFDMSSPTRKGALGILGMHERALAAGAELAVASRPGAGTELILSVPVQEAKGLS